MIPQRKLGTGGLAVPAMGLGCMGMSENYGPVDEREAIATIHRAVELGVTLLDTAEFYGRGRNEELIGEAIRGRREKVVISTKFGALRGLDGRFIGVSGRPEHVRACCESSLKRLGVDTIDLFTHSRMDPKTPVEETVGAMADLVAEGKVRFIGLSEASPAILRRARDIYPIAALQSEYSLWSRDIEREILPVCRELGIGLIAYSPLGRGFLTGRFRQKEQFTTDDYRLTFPRFQDEHFQSNLELLNKVEQLAAQKNCTPSQLALAWVLAQGDDVVPIPGTKQRQYLEQNVAALEVRLTPEELAQIGKAIPPGAASGGRYPDSQMHTVPN